MSGSFSTQQNLLKILYTINKAHERGTGCCLGLQAMSLIQGMGSPFSLSTPVAVL